MKRLLVGLALLLATVTLASAQTTGNAMSGYRRAGTIFSVDPAARTIVIGATQYTIAGNVSIFFSHGSGKGIYSLKKGMHVGFTFEQNSNSGSPVIHEIWVLPANAGGTFLPPPPS